LIKTSIKGALVVRLREFLLIPATGLIVSYVRHGVATGWSSWDSIHQVFVYWLIHTMGLMLFIPIAGGIIFSTQKFFLGYKPQKEHTEEIIFYVMMTILIAAVSIYVVAHWPAGGDYDD
jgi:prolipoprotein diacylglyceryltransferase